tara:strand:- start:589 stop:795 length:207 start_codon:yes stop_codon:yes gene_type:complete
MPYTIFKFDKGKYRVGLIDNQKMSDGRLYLTDRYLSRRDAIKQLYAVSYSEYGHKPKNTMVDKRHYEE